ncbi:hypothetical protein F4811DRAFT_540250 [Daldinia bambusicola]|nr:hypothetical protein F4811DRAFT_540250 [Daldinia bambusicola]
MAPTLSDLVGQYPVLTSIARNLPAVDLFSLGLTCREFSNHILSSQRVLDVFRRDCPCDGRGLLHRQNELGSRRCKRGLGRDSRSDIQQDEEIEVRLFATKCNKADTLPCLKCGINVCEECRFYPRTPPKDETRRPHLNFEGEVKNIMCLCDACDANLEDQLKGRYLEELCDCDRFKRWICFKCAKEEEEEAKEYRRRYIISGEDDFERYVEEAAVTKSMVEDEHEVLFYCVCGALVPDEARPRCTWCKRKHRPEQEWVQEFNQTVSIPFDEEGCYPIFTLLAASYPTLAYSGPIYQVPPGSDHD